MSPKEFRLCIEKVLKVPEKHLLLLREITHKLTSEWYRNWGPILKSTVERGLPTDITELVANYEPREITDYDEEFLLFWALEEAIKAHSSCVFLAKVADKLTGDGPEAKAWHALLQTTLQEGLPPITTEIGTFITDYDETIAAKLVRGSVDERCIGWYIEKEVSDELFPDDRTGKKHFLATTVYFPERGMSDEKLASWCEKNNKIVARLKEGIDLAITFPRPLLDKLRGVGIVGQRAADLEYQNSGGWGLYLAPMGDMDKDRRRHLNRFGEPDCRWGGHILVLEEILPQI
jgi:hypothetical protein